MRLRRRLLEAQWALYAKRLQRSSRPIVLGPWRSELGFELLYWIPFLHAFVKRYRIDPNRLITLGRAGSASWYGTAGTGDLYEHMPLEAVRALTVQASQQTGSIKQQDDPAWERAVCELATTTIGLKQYHRLSPSWMYQLGKALLGGHGKPAVAGSVSAAADATAGARVIARACEAAAERLPRDALVCPLDMATQRGFGLVDADAGGGGVAAYPGDPD